MTASLQPVSTLIRGLGWLLTIEVVILSRIKTTTDPGLKCPICKNSPNTFVPNCGLYPYLNPCLTRNLGYCNIPTLKKQDIFSLTLS